MHADRVVVGELPLGVPEHAGAADLRVLLDLRRPRVRRLGQALQALGREPLGPVDFALLAPSRRSLRPFVALEHAGDDVVVPPPVV